MTVAFPHPMNSFTCDADTLSALLVSLLDDPCPSSGDSFWTARTVRLIRITAPVLAWVRDHEGVPLHMEQIYCACELRSMVLLSTRKLFRVRDWGTCTVREAPVPDIPEALLQPLQAYLGGLPGFDPAVPYEAQGTQAHEQHSYATFFLARLCLHGRTARTEA